MENKLITENPFERTEHSEKVKPNRRKPAPEPVEEEKPVEVEAPVVEKPEASTDLLAELKNKKPTGKGCNIYLDADVIDKLDKLAKQAKTSRSKVINTLLRNLLADK